MPININYEPSGFLQVASSWWGQRRQMAHQVALQEAQMGLQHTAQAQQSFQSGMTGLRQGAAAYQQAQQFDDSLDQQQLQFDANNQRLYDMAYLRYFGQTKDQLNSSRELEIANETVPAGTTAGQYQRKIEIERNKLANSDVFARQTNAYHLQATGMPTSQLDVLAKEQGIPRHEFVAQISQQRQMQQAQAQQAMAVQAGQFGEALNWATAQPKPPDAYARYDAAKQNFIDWTSGHVDAQQYPNVSQYPALRKAAQVELQKSKQALILAHRGSQPNRAAIRADRETRIETYPNPDGGYDRVFYDRDGDYERVTTWEPEGDGAGVRKLDPAWKAANDFAMKCNDVYDAKTGELDPTKVAEHRKWFMEEYERYLQSQEQPGLVQMPELAKLLGQYGKEQAQQQGPAETEMPQQAETPQPPIAKDPAVDEARRVIRELLAKRQAGGQLTPEEHRVLQAAHDVLTRATQQ